MRFLAVIALTMPLAGCFSLTAPKPIPEWATSPQAENTAGPRAKTARNVASRNAVAQPPAVEDVEQTGSVTDTPVSVRPAGLSREVVRSKPATRSAEPTAFSPEWQVREDERDGTLQRSMGNICRGC